MDISEQPPNEGTFLSTPSQPVELMLADQTASLATNDEKVSQNGPATYNIEQMYPFSTQSNTVEKSARKKAEDTGSKVHKKIGGTEEKKDWGVLSSDWKAGADELDEKIEEEFGKSTQSFWNFSSIVTGTVCSAVMETYALNQLRKNIL